MTKKVFFLLAFMSLFSCKKEDIDTNNYDEESPIGCLTCTDEKVSEIYKDVEAVVTRTYHDPIKGIEDTYIFTITKADIQRADGVHTLSQDSILVPCKKIPTGFEIIGKKVKISGQLMSCGKLLGCPFCRFRYGRKFILTKIK